MPKESKSSYSPNSPLDSPLDSPAGSHGTSSLGSLSPPDPSRQLTPLTDKQKFGHVRWSDGQGRMHVIPRKPDNPLSYRPQPARVDMNIIDEDDDNINYNKQKIALLTEEQKIKLLELISSGVLLPTACVQIGVTLGILRATLRSDPSLRDRLRTYEEELVSQHEKIWIDQALTGESKGNHEVAADYVKFRRNLANKERSITMREHALARQQEDFRRELKERDKERSGSGSSGRLNASVLTNDEFNRYVQISNAMQNGVELAQADLIEYGRLQSKVLRASRESRESRETREAMETRASVAGMAPGSAPGMAVGSLPGSAVLPAPVSSLGTLNSNGLGNIEELFDEDE
jgi:hypothetical protein